MLSFVAAVVLQGSQKLDYTKDLDSLLSDLKTYGAFVKSDGVDFAKLASAYRPRFAAATTPDEFQPVIEALVSELHDFHASLGNNNQSSPRLVPSGTDLFARWDGRRAFIEQVRPDSVAERGSVRSGDEVLRINDQPVRQAAAAWFGVLSPTPRGWDWALNSALAGRWNVPRELQIRHAGQVREVDLATAKSGHAKDRLIVRRPAKGIMVLRPEDSLGQNDLIKDFDRLVPEMRKSKGVVIDLRDTPSGGNTSVARGIMGLFVRKRSPYQNHVAEERETGTVRDWVEYVTPRLTKPINAKVVVLVDRWTGSMGEGIAIGFDASKAGTVVGTEMAGLRGAVDSTTLPVSGLRVFFPTERLYHVNGTPRHDWLPPVRVKPGQGDPWMIAAMKTLRP